MNIFFIPSWYPSYTDPLPGIFFRELALALTRHYPHINIAVSTWGQNDDRLLLWSRQPVSSIFKLIERSAVIPSTKQSKNGNLVEYFTPAFTWNSSILQGNMKKIIHSNIDNLKAFRATYGQTSLIHAHVGFPGGYIARKMSKTFDVPYIITEQMSPFPHKHFLTPRRVLVNKLKEAYELAERNVAVSGHLNTQMKSLGIKRLITIPNPVDETFFRPSPNPGRNELFTFFSLGRMVPQKGIDVLLKAFAQLNADVRLRIGGGGKYLEKYKNLAIKLGIKDNIKWLGEIDKNKALIEFQSCDAFVLPSRHESMGVVFVEAMACGKPVIGTICGGPEEFINEDNGFIVLPEDVNGLTETMESMIRRYRQFDPLVIRRQFERRFSSRIVCKQVMEIYTQVVNSEYPD